ncbi:hypothetical protein PG997_010418 [Apiospora hydei]|uniref:WW domain-containing protein n=1 Tax=Apiospora hydei TaxID=1337664 RepID=A0ABR1W010_9PEZI
MRNHTQKMEDLLRFRRWTSCLVLGKHKSGSVNSLEPKSRSSEFRASYDASVLATFDSDCSENLISRDIVEQIIGHEIGDPPSGFNIVFIAFNIIGQKQRFETSHRVTEIPRFENILFGHSRPSEDATGPSPLALHILGQGDLSESCACCTEDVCRLGGPGGVNHYVWYNNTPDGMHRCASTNGSIHTADSACNNRPPACEHIHTMENPRSNSSPSSSELQAFAERLGVSDEGCSFGDRTEEDKGHRLPAVRPEVPKLQQLSRAMSKLASSLLGREIKRAARTRKVKDIIAGKGLPVQTKGSEDIDNQRISLEGLCEATSDYYETPSVPTRPPLRSNYTSSNSDILTRAKKRETSMNRRGEATEQWDYPQEMEEHIREQHEYHQQPTSISSPAHDYIYSGETHITGGIGDVPRSMAGEAVACGSFPTNEGGRYIDYTSEAEVPILPFPDDYWTYDAERQNYYHIDLEDDGSTTKIWYPPEFLEAHRDK